MADYEKMYNQFHLDEKTREQLNQYATRKFPFDEFEHSFAIKTIVSDENNENHNIERIDNAKLG